MTQQAVEPAVETTPPNGIKGLAVAETWWTPEHILMVVLPVALALVAWWLALVWLGRKKSQKQVRQMPVDPWSALGQRIEGLAAPSLDTEDATAWTKFSSDISLAARLVLADASGFPCDDWTTDECATKLQRWQGPEGLMTSDVLVLLRETDLVRFADRRPPATAAQWRDQVKGWYRVRDQQKQMTVSVPSSFKTEMLPKDNTSSTSPPSPPSSDGGLRVFD